jgi:predicted oxidoreductase (fatty acid repression mutant protein)
MKDLMKAIKDRRTFYSITNKSPISNEEIKSLIDTAIINVPSAFNSQSARLALLLNEQHVKFWELVKNVLKNRVKPEVFEGTKSKIEKLFQAGYGTVLFFEDQSVVKRLQEQYPAYKDNFPTYSQHSSAMHQYAVWLLLEDAGFGASLQHYNPLIDSEVSKEWNINREWELIAQMPFGLPAEVPGGKTFESLDERRVFFG